MFVETGCISINKEFNVYTISTYILNDLDSVLIDINATSLALNSVKIYSFE